ncbi:hypothetical protein IBL26_17035 [Roseomonas aerophila]|uniref:Uncharacterized protein n=1 Tax=Teichococcus aerophilus TaxID=1224513 RepID=A0ABR7RQL1_9PROT|nr:hypothetical protein [Pseudoroseomonas aerophila]MBC9208556.1 hypothetical protein [Pseudoroseomonas aerophila]
MPYCRPAESVAALPLAEHAVLWCMRLWVDQVRLGGHPGARIAQVFEDLGVEGGGRRLEACLALWHRGAGRLPRVHCLGDRVVGEEEALLLDAIALQQRQGTAEAVALLSCIMPHLMALQALPALAGIAQALEARGLWLARRPAVQQPPWLRCFPAMPGPGSLHPANGH